LTPRARSHRRRQGGFTIVELLIALVLSTLLIAVAFQIGIIVVNGYRQHREAVGIQRAARGSLDLIADMVRNGSAGVPTANLKDAAGCSSVVGLSVVNNTTSPDELYVIAASGQAVTSTRLFFDQTKTSLTVVDAADIADNDLLIVTDFSKGHVVRVSGDPVDNGDGTWTVSIDAITCAGMTFTYDRGALVLRAKVAHFYVDDVDGIPTMMMDDDSDGPDVAEPLAEGIEDFQVAVGVDSNSDGTVTDATSTTDEWFYNKSGDSDPPVITTKPWTALRLTVVARNEREDVGQDWSARPAAEDHTAGSLDGFRRREAATTIQIRNLSSAP
jgi:Tfp pilus assembly protein PilW